MWGHLHNTRLKRGHVTHPKNEIPPEDVYNPRNPGEPFVSCSECRCMDRIESKERREKENCSKYESI